MKIKDIVNNTTVQEVCKFLFESPDDELFTLKELAARFDISESTLKNSKPVQAHKVSHGSRNYYGSIAAIEEFKKQTGPDED